MNPPAPKPLLVSVARRCHVGRLHDSLYFYSSVSMLLSVHMPWLTNRPVPQVKVAPQVPHHSHKVRTFASGQAFHAWSISHLLLCRSCETFSHFLRQPGFTSSSLRALLSDNRPSTLCSCFRCFEKLNSHGSPGLQPDDYTFVLTDWLHRLWRRTAHGCEARPGQGARL